MKRPSKVLSRVAGSVALKLAIVVTAGVGGAALVSSSVLAALTAVASNTTPTSVTSGKLSLTLAPSSVTGISNGFNTAIANMAPGDTINRYVDLTNGGTIDGLNPTLGITLGEAGTALVTNATAGLQVAVQSCSVSWSATGTCTGTTGTVLASSAVSTMTATPKAITLPSLTAGSVSFLKVSIALPAANENVLNGVLPGGTVQNLSNTLTWTFTESARAGVVTNS